MFKNRFFLLIYTTSLFIFSINCYSAIIAIFGDIHGDIYLFDKAITHFKEKNVTHLIGTGDYGFLSFTPTESVLKLLAKTGVPRENIVIMPGNWEHETGDDILIVNETLKNFGTLVTPECEVGRKEEKYRGVILDEGSGYATIDGKKIRISHFPQHPIEDRYLQDIKYRQRRDFHRISDEKEGQPFQELIIKRNSYPSADTNLEVYAHTHKRAFFKDTASGVYVLNSGAICSKRSDPEASYAIYDTVRNEISFYDIENNSLIQSFSLKN